MCNHVQTAQSIMNQIKKITENEINFIKDNYTENGAIFCSKALNIKRQRVSYIANCILKIKLSPKLKLHYSSIAATNKPYDKYSVNPTQFFNIQSPEIAYILGILWADGHVQVHFNHKNHPHYRVTLSTTYPDIDEILPTFLKTGKWSVYEKKTYNKKHKRAFGINTSNRPLTEFLISKDYKTKSWDSADKILKEIPEHLQHYWFRGLVDGDAHIAKDCITIYSGYEQNWSYIETLCHKLNIRYSINRRIRNCGGSGEITIRKKQGLKTFLDYIYQNREDDKMGLSRKYYHYKSLFF